MDKEKYINFVKSIIDRVVAKKDKMITKDGETIWVCLATGNFNICTLSAEITVEDDEETVRIKLQKGEKSVGILVNPQFEGYSEISAIFSEVGRTHLDSLIKSCAEDIESWEKDLDSAE